MSTKLTTTGNPTPTGTCPKCGHQTWQGLTHICPTVPMTPHPTPKPARACPQCGGSVEKVRYPSDSMLNEYQWDSVRAGDWYCQKCPPNNRSNTKLCYWWDDEVTKYPSPAQGTAERPPITLRMTKKRVSKLGGPQYADTCDDLITDWQTMYDELVAMRELAAPSIERIAALERTLAETQNKSDRIESERDSFLLTVERLEKERDEYKRWYDGTYEANTVLEARLSEREWKLDACLVRLNENDDEIISLRERLSGRDVELAQRDRVLQEVVAERDMVRQRLATAQAERDRFHSLLNTPETEDFDKAVPLEAAHQVERWGTAHDAGKNPEDWFWLIGYLAGKCLASQKAGDSEKAKHHAITAAAACRNWHAALRNGWSLMRPGIEEPK